MLMDAVHKCRGWSCCAYSVSSYTKKKGEPTAAVYYVAVSPRDVLNVLPSMLQPFARFCVTKNFTGSSAGNRPLSACSLFTTDCCRLGSGSDLGG